jgi:long-chain acyl-CoA synthetase
MTGKPSIDKPWLKYYPEGVEKIPLPEATAYQHLYNSNKDYFDGIALEYFGKQISFGEVFDHIDLVAKSFVAIGVKAGDIVTLCLPNMPEAVYCIYALNKIGAVANMISPIFTPEHIAGSINLTESKALVVLDKFHILLNKVFESTTVPYTIVVSGEETFGKIASETDNALLWSGFINKGKAVESVLSVSYVKHMPAVIVYSSGSTGASKGVVLPNETFSGFAYLYPLSSTEYQRTQKALLIVPLFLSTSIVISLNLMLCLGVTAILEPVFSSEAFANIMLASRPNNIVTTTSQWVDFVNSLEKSNDDLSFIKCPIAGGEASPLRVQKKINNIFRSHNIVSDIGMGWGESEFGSCVTRNLWTEKPHKGTGKPVSHNIVSSFNIDTNEELSYGEKGELRVVTPYRMNGYYKNDEATKALFHIGLDGQEWGHSGDIGYVDEEGNVYVEGRAHDYINAENGNKVWLFDIENILLEDPDVQLCEAVGLDSASGDFGIPVVHLVLRQDFSGDPNDVIYRVHRLCVDRLQTEAVPHGYKIRTAFGLNPGGKRDTLSLKSEREGFVQVVGTDINDVLFY